MAKQMLENSHTDHSACGIGITANLDGTREHVLVTDALRKLASMDSRGGAHIEHNTGDGAGIKTHIPTKLLQQFLTENGSTVILHDGEFGVGQMFLPRDEVPGEDGLTPSQRLIQSQLGAQGLKVAGWRNVPVKMEGVSEVARNKMPDIRQVIFTFPDSIAKADYAKKAMEARVAIEITAQEVGSTLFIASFSTESIIYKGMFRASEVGAVFPDLSNPLYETAFTEIHVRMSTNTSPEHWQAQPCGIISHNGEHNTISKNESDLQVIRREVPGASGSFVPGLSDSLRYDEDIRHLTMQGYTASEAIILLSPPLIDSADPSYSDDVKAMVAWMRHVRTPYNGPAHMVFAAGGEIGAKLDSSGLRPSRVVETNEDGKKRLHVYSEDMVETPWEQRTKSYSLTPGEMVLIKDGVVYRQREILEAIAAKKPKGYYQALLAERTVVLSKTEVVSPLPALHLRERQEAAFWDQDILKVMVEPMMDERAQKVIAMGDDTPIPALSGRPEHVSRYAMQKFAQVTNPPLDPIREESSFTMQVRLGCSPLVSDTSKQVVVDSPVLGIGQLAMIEKSPLKTARLDMVFPSSYDGTTKESLRSSAVSMRDAITVLCLQAEEAVRAGVTILILSDRQIDKTHAPIPDAIAVAAVDKHLKEKGLRARASIVAESAQVNSPHQASLLMAFGASAVYPYMAYEEIGRLFDGRHTAESEARALLEKRAAPVKESEQVVHEIMEKFTQAYADKSFAELCDNYHHAMAHGHMKTMGKMGITDAESYIGSGLMEFIGLDLNTLPEEPKSVADKPTLGKIFAGNFSPIGGDKLSDIAVASVVRHHFAMLPQREKDRALPDNGLYAYSKGGIPHGYGPDAVSMFSNMLGAEAAAEIKGQRLPDKEDGCFTATAVDSFEQTPAYRAFSTSIEMLRAKNPVSLMDAMVVRSARPPVEKSEVQPVSSIVKKSWAGGMSYGALTKGAWKTVAAAENALGAGSNAGEGGEPMKYFGTAKNAKGKQIASGRFGISPEMLAAIKQANGMIEIKVAQGAKPGEGGQLSGLKVNADIAALRGSIPGVDLVSPPPHHDIYSIEDLKELIHDLKAAGIKVGVKLVASSGIGTIACGVVKAGADEINIAGHSGGTGAASATSIHNTGMPAEVGLSMVDQSLRAAGLRDVVKLKTSSAFKDGWDIVKAAILGADRFEWGTTELMLVGCKMLRLCNIPGGCAPGVTNSGEHFRGEGKDIERFKLNVAAEVQEILAGLGFKSLKEIRGHTELLSMDRVPEYLRHKFDFSRMLYRPENVPVSVSAKERHKTPASRKDDEVLSRMENIFPARTEEKHRMEAVRLDTTDRAFGAKLSVEASKVFRRKDSSLKVVSQEGFVRVIGKKPLPLKEGQYYVSDDYVTVRTVGNAGQSYGFINAHGIALEHIGPVQDGLGKSMAGGVIAVITPKHEGYLAHESVIAGNACFYGAYGGKAFVNGQAGNRFAVELHGATVVVEGMGDYGCEFMTSGTVLNLGKVGKHFGAGAVGGIAIQYDPAKTFERSLSSSVRLATPEETNGYLSVIQGLLKEHATRTGSGEAIRILEHWEHEKNHFRIAIPKSLDQIKTVEQRDEVTKTFQKQTFPVSPGMQTWFERLQQQSLGSGQSATSSSHKIGW